MSNQKQSQNTIQNGRTGLMNTLVFGVRALGFVLIVGAAGFIAISNLNMGTVAQVAEVGPGLYAKSMQLPKG